MLLNKCDIISPLENLRHKDMYSINFLDKCYMSEKIRSKIINIINFDIINVIRLKRNIYEN